MRSNLTVLFLCFLSFPGIALAQNDTINQVDKNGNRHGFWREYYDESSEMLKFEGEFSHGKESGLFKFYEQGLKQPTAIMEFSTLSDTVKGKFLTQQGKIVSEGHFVDQQRTGIWVYYHDGSDKILMTENYKNGVLHGIKKTYYPDGQLAEKANYLNGNLHGEWFMYSEDGVVLEHLTYDNGELHGPAKFYNGKGELVTEGNYKRDMHHGIWKYYQNGKLKEEKDYSK